MQKEGLPSCDGGRGFLSTVRLDGVLIIKMNFYSQCAVDGVLTIKMNL